MSRAYVWALFSILVAGCGGGSGDAGDDQDAENRLLETQRQAMDKAREVDSVLQDAASREREAVDEQSR